jgi:hypothetical protein
MNKLLVATFVCFLLPFAFLGGLFLFLEQQPAPEQTPTKVVRSPTQETLGNFGLFLTDYWHVILLAFLVSFGIGLLLAMKALGRPRSVH